MSILTTYDYAEMHGHVEALGGALDAAIVQDRSEAQSFFTDLRRLAKHGTDYGAEAERFDRQANRLVALANVAMTSIMSKCNGKLLGNAPVPGRLEADAEKWKLRAYDAQLGEAECAKLIGLPGWTGKAQRRYDLAIGVQKEALHELMGVLKSTAQSCLAGATLNRAIFCAVGNGAVQARGRIADRQKYGASNDMYYVRTANAIPILEAFDGLVDRAISGEVATGSADVLSGEHQSTVSMPNLLSEGQWPTGTSAAGIRAAATESGVISDGEDAKTRLDAILNMCMAGANL